MYILDNVWKRFQVLPSAWLLFLQFVILLLSLFSHHNMPYKVITWMVGVLVLLLIAKVIRQTPMLSILGLSFVYAALFFSFFILLGVRHPLILVMSHACEAAALF